MKEHGKNPQHQTNEEEIVYLKDNYDDSKSSK